MEPIYQQSCSSMFCFILWHHQSSQVDLFAQSELDTYIHTYNGVDVVGDTACVTPLEGSGGMLPEEILTNRSS